MEKLKQIKEKMKSMTKQQKIVSSIVSLGVVLAVIIGTVIFTGNTASTMELKKKTFTFEYGTMYSTNKADYIKADKEVLDDLEIEVNSIKLSKTPIAEDVNDFKKMYAVGEYKGVAKYKDETLNFIVVIKDTKAPTFVDFKDRIEIEREYDAKKLTTHFTFKDVSDADIKVNSKNVNFSKAGEYKATVTVTDAHKNKTTKTFTVVVGEKSQAELEAEKKKVEEQEKAKTQAENDRVVQEQTSQNNGSTGNGNAGGSNPNANNGGTTNNTGGGSSTPPTTCQVTGWQMVSNSGYANHDYQTAYNWGENNCPGDQYYKILSTKDNCGNAGWTIMFKNQE